jgi:hypothetical protein
MEYDKDKVDDTVLALLFLTMWGDSEAAKLRGISLSDYVRTVTVPQARREVLAAREQTLAMTPRSSLPSGTPSPRHRDLLSLKSGWERSCGAESEPRRGPVP